MEAEEQGGRESTDLGQSEAGVPPDSSLRPEDAVSGNQSWLVNTLKEKCL